VSRGRVESNPRRTSNPEDDKPVSVVPFGELEPAPWLDPEADDFVVLCRSPDDAAEVLEKVKDWTASASLPL